MSKNIELVTEFKKAVDEQFYQESKVKKLFTSDSYIFDGSKTIKVYSITTAPLNDYNRDGDIDLTSGVWSRYGEVLPLEAKTQSFTMSQDKAFTYEIDKLDRYETGDALEAASSLARQNREVVIPAFDQYCFKKIAENAGTVKTGTLDENNIYDEILEANAVLDEAMVPDSQRVIAISPENYKLLKLSTEIILPSDMGQDMRLRGVVGVLDGVLIVKIPASRLPENTGFLLVHPSAIFAPVVLQDYGAHENPPGLSGSLCEGRYYYDCFILNNKKKAIYLFKTSE